MTCINCGDFFVKKRKGYNRFSAQKDIEMISDIFKLTSRICDRDLHGVFFCNPCHSAIIRLRKSSDTIKSTLGVLSGIIKPRNIDLLDESNNIPRKIPRPVTPIESFQGNCSQPTTLLGRRKRDTSIMARRSFRAKAVEAILDSKYKTALKFLLRSSIAFRKSFIKKVAYITRAEVRSLAKTSTELSKPLCVNTIEHFSWEKVDKEVLKICPMLHAVLKAVPFHKKKSSAVHLKQLGVVISILLHFVRPGTFKLFQCLNSVELKRSGCQVKTLKYLHQLGLNMSLHTTRRLVAKVKTDLDHGDGARTTLGVEPQDEENATQLSDGDADGDEGDDMKTSSDEEEVETSSEEEVDLDMEVFEVPDEEQADG